MGTTPDQTPKEFLGNASLSDPLRKGLEPIFSAFARDLSMNLSAYLRVSSLATYKELLQLPYSKFLSRESGALPCLASANLEWAQRKLIVSLPLPMVFKMLEILLGGKPAGPVQISRQPTEIEKHLMAVLLQRMVTDLDSAFKENISSGVAFSRIEVENNWTQLFGPGDLVLVARFDLSLDGDMGELALVIPDEVGRKIVKQMQNPEPAQADPAAQGYNEARLLELLSPASVSLEAWLAGVSIKVGDMLRLREGQVILFEQALDRNVTCTVNGDAAFSGQIVSTGQKRAFLVEVEYTRTLRAELPLSDAVA